MQGMTADEILAQQKANAKRHEEARKRVPLPSSTLPVSEQLRAKPHYNLAWIEQERGRHLAALDDLIVLVHRRGLDIDISDLQFALVEPPYEGDDGFYYAKVDIIGGYVITGPHEDRRSAIVGGWDLLHSHRA